MLSGMDAKSARTANIRLWVAQEGGPTEFSAKSGGRWVAAQISQWISDTNPKGIGHNLARNIERALNKEPNSMDRPPESQPLGIDHGKLHVATQFLEQMFSARKRVFVASERTMMLAAVYDELLRASEPNLVEMTVRYGRQLDEEDERQRAAGGT